MSVSSWMNEKSAILYDVAELLADFRRVML